MAAFLSVQVPAEDQIRLKPSSELYLTMKAQQVSKKTSWLRVRSFPQEEGRWQLWSFTCEDLITVIDSRIACPLVDFAY